MGSSTVITLCVQAIDLIQASSTSVVVFPLPVGPQISTMPDGLATASSDHGALALGDARVGQGELAGILVQHPDRDLLAVEGPGAGHAEGDVGLALPGGKGAVLRPAPFRQCPCSKRP